MTEVKKTNSAKKTSTAKKNESSKIAEMEKTIKSLTDMVQLLMSQGVGVSATNNNPDRDINFISLCNHTLNLSTEPYGQGTVYTFTEFGEEQPIPYSDARRIIKSNKKFIKGGKCYIADDEIIDIEHLTSDYKKILTKEALLSLLEKNRTDFIKLFDSLTDMQKNIFKDIVLNKLRRDKNSVDMNIVQYINEKLNINLLEDVNYDKELLKED